MADIHLDIVRTVPLYLIPFKEVKALFPNTDDHIVKIRISVINAILGFFAYVNEVGHKHILAVIVGGVIVKGNDIFGVGKSVLFKLIRIRSELYDLGK